MAPILEFRSFLSILSLRSGLWVLCSTALMLGISGAVATGLEMSILLAKGRSLELLNKVSLFVQMIVLSLLGLVAIFGILTGIFKRKSVVKVFNRLVLGQAVLMLGALGFTLYTSLRPAKDGEINSCVSSSTNWVVIQFCQQGLSLIKAFPVIWFSVATVVQTWTFIIAANYVEELDVEKASRISRSFTIKSFIIGKDTTMKQWVPPSDTYPGMYKGGIV